MTMLLSHPRAITVTREIEQPAGSDSDNLVAAPRLTVIVPTYCEAENVDPMIAALDAVLAGIRWEVIFVDDDSPDGSAHLVRERGEHDSRVRAVRRIVRRGLAGAAIEGMQAFRAVFTAAKLDGTSFKGANLARAVFEFASLRDVNFTGADLSGCSLASADLTGANESPAQISTMPMSTCSRCKGGRVPSISRKLATWSTPSAIEAWNDPAASHC